MPVNRSHDAFLAMLVRNAASQRYPSHQVLGRIEQSAVTREALETYVDLLVAQAARQRHPSLLMIDRAQAAVARLVAADVQEQLRRSDDGDADASDDD